jgi:hypothetical protein
VIVAVESNFVLELTLRQDEVQDGERLIELARAKSIELVIPACSLFEPYETLGRRRKQREEISRRLKAELRELTRTQAYADLGETSGGVTHALAESGQLQAKALNSTIDTILRVATVIPMTSEVVRRALTFQLVFPFSPQDSNVFASIDQYLQQQGDGKKVFANKNRRDFLKGSVEAHLEKYDCKVLGGFLAARRFVENSIAKKL